MIPKISDKCSKYFRFKDFFECSDTYKISSIPNIPKELETYEAIKYFSSEILDKVRDSFGDVVLSYGFCNFELSKVIKKNIFPKTDQHAGFEKNSKGNLICERKGFASDFKIEGLSSLILAQWIVENCMFDRLYFYGEDRPVHVSTNLIPTKKIVLMKFYKTRRVPQNISEADFLNMKPSIEKINL